MDFGAITAITVVVVILITFYTKAGFISHILAPISASSVILIPVVIVGLWLFARYHSGLSRELNFHEMPCKLGFLDCRDTWLDYLDHSMDRYDSRKCPIARQSSFERSL